MCKKMGLLLFTGLLVLNLTGLANAWPGEPKLYVSTNREQYGPEETVRFQAILLAASSNPQHSIFAELYDCKGNRLAKKIFPVIDQLASGSIDLPANRKDDFYLLYCYTLSSNGRTEYDFIKRINIRSTPQVPGMIPASWSVNDLSLEVFLEGNNFVSGLNNTLLVKTFYKKEQPLAVTGRMINEKDEVVGIFQTNEQGFAKIEFKPDEKGTYFIAVEDKAGNEKQAHLPKPSPVGVNLSAFFKDSMLYIKWSSYTSTVKQPLDYRMEISGNGQVVYDATLNFKPGVSEILQDININDLPEGYLLLKLFENGAKKTERILYNMHSRQTGSVIRIVDTLQHKEAIVELPSYINGKGYVQIAGSGMQVSAAAPGLNNYGRSVLVPVLDPAAATSPDFNDLLIAAKKIPYSLADSFPPATEYLSISGTLHNKEGALLKNKAVNIIVVQKNLRKQFYVTQTDGAGKLKIGNLVFFDTASVYYQLAEKSEDKNNVVLELDPAPVPLNHLNPGGINFTCSPGNSPDATKNDDKTLQQVVIKGQPEKTETEKFQEKYADPMMSKKTGMRNEFDFIKNPQELGDGLLLDFIRGRFAGLQIRMLSDGSLSILTTYKAPVNVYLNDQEISATDMNALEGLLVRDVAQVKYSPLSFKAKNSGGNPFLDPKAQDGGDLLIYTKKDFVPADAAIHGLPMIKLAGYDIEKKKGDLLYWNPNFLLKKEQVIYIGLPPTALATRLRLEGLNNEFAPYSFSKELIFK